MNPRTVWPARDGLVLEQSSFLVAIKSVECRALGLPVGIAVSQEPLPSRVARSKDEGRPVF